MNLEDTIQGIDRRTFLKIVSLTGMAALMSPRDVMSLLTPADLSRVVIVENSNATELPLIDAEIVQGMMDDAIRALTCIPDVGLAWKSLFPGITPTSTVAIKINAFSALTPTHPEVTYAVVNGLKEMIIDSVPFPENNIVIFDNANIRLTNAGYVLNTSTAGVRCFGTIGSGVGYTTETFDVNGAPQRISNIVAEMADYLINISVLKNHGAAGVTLCLKNHYGTCDSPDTMHGNFCDPYIPAMNTLPPIRDIQCLNICDALFGVISGGPDAAPQVTVNTIIMSRDIVAVDYWGREILQENGCETLDRAIHIDTAAQEPYNLGTNDPLLMDVVTISDTATGAADQDDIFRKEDILLRQNHPNPFSNHTRIQFHLSRTEHVDVTVYDIAGRRVCALVGRTGSTGWHTVSWDGRNDSGRPVSSGVYFCLARTRTFKKSIRMHVLR